MSIEELDELLEKARAKWEVEKQRDMDKMKLAREKEKAALEMQLKKANLELEKERAKIRMEEDTNKEVMSWIKADGKVIILSILGGIIFSAIVFFAISKMTRVR